MRVPFIGHTRRGDAVLSSGLLGHLNHTRARVAVVCGPLPAHLFAAAPGVERVIAVEKRRWDRHWLALWPLVARRRWDLVVDLCRSSLPWLVRGRRRPVMPRADEHRVVTMARTLDAEPPAPRLWATPEQRAESARHLPAGAPVLGVGPTANWRGKIWPASRFTRLVERLTGPGGILPGARVAVFGSAAAAAVPPWHRARGEAA